MLPTLASFIMWLAWPIALASLAHTLRAALAAWRALMETRPYD